jgi:Zn-dependent peptidase ImmA (M78 family)
MVEHAEDVLCEPSFGDEPISYQEEEADWMGGCLLLPRAVLLGAAYDGKTAAQIADEHGTSEAMARFRLNGSGVLVQVGRERAPRAEAGRRRR